MIRQLQNGSFTKEVTHVSQQHKNSNNYMYENSLCENVVKKDTNTNG